IRPAARNGAGRAYHHADRVPCRRPRAYPGGIDRRSLYRHDGPSRRDGMASVAREAGAPAGRLRQQRTHGSTAMPRGSSSVGSANTAAEAAMDWLRRSARRRNIEAMARYGIPSTNAVGVTVGEIKAYSTRIGKCHELALKLW